jgi:hypothetical protein
MGDNTNASMSANSNGTTQQITTSSSPTTSTSLSVVPSSAPTAATSTPTTGESSSSGSVGVTDESIRGRLATLAPTIDLTTTSAKAVRQQLEQEFGVSLSHKKVLLFFPFPFVPPNSLLSTYACCPQKGFHNLNTDVMH